MQNIKYAKLPLEQHVDAEVEHEYDFSFPLYGKSMQDTMYQSNPFIPIIQAPSVALLVRSENVTSGNTKFIAKTIIGFWPMYLFILLIASSAGIIMLCLVSMFLLKETIMLIRGAHIREVLVLEGCPF
jgi:hypothetical protein